MLSFLLQCCCGRWRHRQYHIKKKSFRERLFSSNNINDRRYIYTTNNLYIPTDPSSIYAMSGNNSLYSSSRSYVTTDNIPFHTDEFHPIIFVSDQRTTNDLTERTIKKNYIITETKNYYVQQRPFYNEYYIKHNQDIQILPGPTITIINMAAERIIDDPNWEEAHPFEIQYNRHYEASRIQNYMKYENQPNIQYNLNKIINNDNDSIISEISGNDSESIYVYTPSNQCKFFEDKYKAADIDEIEIGIKDLMYLQKNK